MAGRASGDGGKVRAVDGAISSIEASERKFVSVLFADIVGSTALIANLDPEDALDRLGPAMAAMQQAIQRYGGIVCKEQGDGVMALFGAPEADDDHAVHACL